MGGNNPLVVWHAADVDAAAMIAVQSAYLTAGQRCTAARRLIVEDGQEGELLDEIQRLIDRIIVDQPFADPQPFMGPVIDIAAADHVQEQWLGLMMKGGKPLRRLDRPFEERPFLTPGADRRDRRQGPPRRGDFRARAAGHPGQGFRRGDRRGQQHPLRPCRQPDRRQPGDYDNFWANVRAGVINWNKPTNGAPSNAPFGGLGLSGNHRPSAFYAADYCAYPVTSSEADQPRARRSAKACATPICRRTDAGVGSFPVPVAFSGG